MIVPVGFTILGVWWMFVQLDQLILPRIFGAIGLERAQPPAVGAIVTLGLILLAVARPAGKAMYKQTNCHHQKLGSPTKISYQSDL